MIYGPIDVLHPRVAIVLVVVTSLILSPFILIQKVAAQPSIIKDPSQKVESLVSGMSSPTSNGVR